MAETTLWRGSPSQWKNFGLFLVCGLFCWLIVPIFIALARYLQTKNHVYELTSERLKTTQGVFSKVTDSLELYRVKDLETVQPFWLRMVGLETVQINTSDLTSPMVFVEAVPQSVHFGDQLRNAVETIRAQKNVRELDVE